MSEHLSPTPPIPIVTSVAEMAADTDAWICDIWGVLHDGVAAFPAAVSACREYRARGGRIVLLSNAPRPASSVAAQLDGIGVPRDAYDAIVSSGDLTRRMISAMSSPAIYHLGPQKDAPIFTGLDVTFRSAGDCALVVCSGLFDDEAETPDHYRDELTALVQRGVPMICANPDLTVERGSRLVYCAGALAQLYESVGGAVTWAGKPHRPAYDLALETLARLHGAAIERRRLLAIGDSLRTDIKGAHDAGIASLFIASAIHVPGTLTPAALDLVFTPDRPERPKAAMAGLAW